MLNFLIYDLIVSVPSTDANLAVSKFTLKFYLILGLTDNLESLTSVELDLKNLNGPGLNKMRENINPEENIST